MEFLWAVQGLSPNVITTAGSKSCHCLHRDFPFCKTSGPRRYFPWINFEAVPALQPPTATAAFSPSLSIWVSFPLSQHVVRTNTVHGLTLPKAPLQTHTINNDAEGHNYMFSIIYSFADYADIFFLSL